MSTDLTNRLERLIELARAYSDSPLTARRNAATEYLFEVGELLNDLSGQEQILAPLLDVIPIVADPTSQTTFEDRRRGDSPPSDAMMARVCVTMEVLMDAGYQPDQAAQLVARQLVRTGITAPAEGGDARAWRRLQLYRERLLHLKASSPAWSRYLEFKSQTAVQPRQSVLEAALDGTLWNRRAKSGGGAS